MTIYQLYTKGHLRLAIEKKILKDKVQDYCEYYFVFLNMRKEYGYDESVERTAEICITSERTIKRAISIVTK